ncbi:hypothetical protein [Acinetobacter sp. AL9]|uniref:hypothetical protein n=1 Tax=Acinetobacter sp. AL9 TaxID=3273234 RepID=UPI0035576AF6
MYPNEEVDAHILMLVALILSIFLLCAWIEPVGFTGFIGTVVLSIPFAAIVVQPLLRLSWRILRAFLNAKRALAEAQEREKRSQELTLMSDEEQFEREKARIANRRAKYIKASNNDSLEK